MSIFTRKKTLIMLTFIMQINVIWAYSPYSNQELDQLEKEFIEQINNSNSLLRNPLASQYINSLGKRLADAGKMPAPHFFIVKANDINAFAGPGGYIGINTQLILTTESESELAGVMAHEMAHVQQHHLYRMIEYQKHMQVPKLASLLAALALGMVDPTLGSGALMATMSGFVQNDISLVRSHEKEADRIGINLLTKAQINPQGMAAFFQKMQQNSRLYYNNIPSILRTHPIDADRIAEAEDRIQNLKHHKYHESHDYQLFKELIRVSTTKNYQSLLNFYKKDCIKTSNQDACSYGYAQTLLKTNDFKKAELILKDLAYKKPDNLYYKIALADTYIGLKLNNKALSILQELHANFPEAYAVTTNLADVLLHSNKPAKAASILLVAHRTYKQDISVCLKLARAQALSGQKEYAYFTQ